MNLIKEIKTLQKSKVKNKVEKRLKEFSSFQNKNTKQWFSELCFCLLTANSRAKTAMQIQKELAVEGFCSSSFSDICNCIIRNKHRFHNNKTKYIIEARKYIDIKKRIGEIVDENGQVGAREWLVANVKGLGYKEASHFLRNVGYFDLAILDRHIINLMTENKMIREKPKTLSKKIYLEIEKKFNRLASKLNMSSAELDLYMWFMKTGEILK
jgi:N-glycosylase/DNA lyase